MTDSGKLNKTVALHICKYSPRMIIKKKKRKEKHLFAWSMSTYNVKRIQSLWSNSMINCSFLPFIFLPYQQRGPAFLWAGSLSPSPPADTENSSRGLQPQAGNPGAPKDRVGHTRSLIVTLRAICCVALEKSLKEDLDREWKYICILFCIWLTTGFLLKCWKQVNVWKSNLQQYKTLQFCPHASIGFFLASLPHLAEWISLKNKASE